MSSIEWFLLALSIIMMAGSFWVKILEDRAMAQAKPNVKFKAPRQTTYFTYHLVNLQRQKANFGSLRSMDRAA